MRVEPDQIKTLAIFGGLMAVVSIGIWLPAQMERSRLQLDIEQAQIDLGIDESEGGSLVQLNQSVAEMRQMVRGAQRHVSEQGELADLLRGLTESMMAFGVTDQEVVTNRIQHFAHYSVIPVDLRFRGSFPSADGVLRLVEQMPRPIRIEILNIRGRADEPGTPVEVDLKLSTFFSSERNGES